MTNVDLSTLHPSPGQIFRLWQIYLDNVNPLLKVSHTPTLQARIINAAGNLSNIHPTLEALMFSIYCVSVLSLVEDECRTLFGSSRTDLLTSYQFGCQQALMNCGVLRSSEVDSLTALFLYLVSMPVCRPEHPPLIESRYPSDELPILGLYPRRLASQFASPNAWVFKMSQRMPNVPPSKRRCAADFGGRWSCSTIASAKCPI